MDDKLCRELASSVKEVARIARGRSSPKSVYVVLAPSDIQAIRARVGMSQAVFARTFQLGLDTLKGWEQGKRSPDAAATNYLRIIAADPEYVQRLIAA